jgi:ubiquinone/menaquinone biosynthesis C-methylase UbiE
MDLLNFEEKIVHHYFGNFYRWFTLTRLGDVYARIAEDAVDRVQSGKVLDVGCGPGNLLVAIAKYAKAEGKLIKVFGADYSAALVREGQKALVKQGLQDIAQLELADAHSLPFPPEEFELVVSTGSIHHWRQPIVVLNEIHRVLAVRGTLLIYDQRKPKGPADVVNALRQGFVGLGLTALTDEGLVDLFERSNFGAVEVTIDGMMIRLVAHKGR